MRNSFLRLVCIFGLFNNESMEPAPVKVSLNERGLSDVVKDAEKYLEESKNMDYSVDKQRIDNIPLMDYVQQMFVKLEGEHVSYFKWLFVFQSLGEILSTELKKSIFDTKAIQEAVSNTKSIHPTSLGFINALENGVMMSLFLRKIKHKMNDLLLRIEGEKKGEQYKIEDNKQDPSLVSRLMIKDVKALLGEMTSFPILPLLQDKPGQCLLMELLGEMTSFPILPLLKDKPGQCPLMEYIITAGINRSSEQEKIWVAFVDACGKFNLDLQTSILIPSVLGYPNQPLDRREWSPVFLQQNMLICIRAIEKYLEETRTTEYSNDKQEVYDSSIVEYMIHMLYMMKALNITYLEGLISAGRVIYMNDDKYIYSLKYLVENEEFDTKGLHLAINKIKEDISPHILKFISALEDCIKFNSDLKEMTTEVDYCLEKSNWKDICAAKNNYLRLRNHNLEEDLKKIEKGVIPFSDTGYEAEEHMKKIRHYLSRISSSNVIYIMKIIEGYLDKIEIPKDNNKVLFEYKSLAKEISNKYKEYISIFSKQKEKYEKERSEPSLLDKSTLKGMKCVLKQMIQMADGMPKKVMKYNDNYNLLCEFEKITKDSESQELKAVWDAFETEVKRLDAACDI